MKRKQIKVETVRIIRDSRDASRDYFLPVKQAREKYVNGELLMDLTNHCYCEK